MMYRADLTRPAAESGRSAAGAHDLIHSEELRAGLRAVPVAGTGRHADVARDEVLVRETSGILFADAPRRPIWAASLHDRVRIREPPVLGEAIGLSDTERLGHDRDVMPDREALARELAELARARVIQRDERVGP